ncbi:DUF6346 domain-containing protein [Krasilnikovia sp. M28-CT-15]|uniref:DUF6346 domain-containing protein n=1 Tax=Krasilnikovia sp. M28-CT-15 TaxID=3373540 RepID=UPI0038772366
MQPPDDRIAKRLAEIRAEEAALDAEEAERRAPTADAGAEVVDRRKGGALRTAVFLIVVIGLAAGLFGVAVTLNRLAGDDIADARRLGTATVKFCERAGPVTNKGFGYWDRCTATVDWEGGGVERLTVGAVFTSDDIGKPVRVGDLGNYRTSRKLVLADAPYRPWLGWIGIAIGLVGFVPCLIGTLMVRELLRFRRR